VGGGGGRDGESGRHRGANGHPDGHRDTTADGHASTHQDTAGDGHRGAANANSGPSVPNCHAHGYSYAVCAHRLHVEPRQKR